MSLGHTRREWDRDRRMDRHTHQLSAMQRNTFTLSLFRNQLDASNVRQKWGVCAHFMCVHTYLMVGAMCERCENWWNASSWRINGVYLYRFNEQINSIQFIRQINAYWLSAQNVTIEANKEICLSLWYNNMVFKDFKKSESFGICSNIDIRNAHHFAYCLSYSFFILQQTTYISFWTSAA